LLGGGEPGSTDDAALGEATDAEVDGCGGEVEGFFEGEVGDGGGEDG
jgi:hypothetical protein